MAASLRAWLNIFPRRRVHLDEDTVVEESIAKHLSLIHVVCMVDGLFKRCDVILESKPRSDGFLSIKLTRLWTGLLDLHYPAK